MKKLLNTLYIMNPDYYLSLDNETIKVTCEDQVIGRFPLLNFEGIITHGYRGVSAPLMGECMRKNIAISFLSRSGRFLGRVSGPVQGNVLLRKEQYRRSDNLDQSLDIARNIIFAKTHNQRWLIDRYIRDHKLAIETDELMNVRSALTERYQFALEAESLESLRGIEGESAQLYFSIFDILILRQKDDFHFSGRSRRPPMDRVNCILSYLYTILSHDVASALECVGLDPYVGFLHRDRPGRMSLALDLMEELRSVLVDRSVLTLINRLEIQAKHFSIREDHAVEMSDDGKRIVLNYWQSRKQEELIHPYLKEKIAWGQVPYTQALLLGKALRGDIDAYPPFIYRI